MKRILACALMLALVLVWLPVSSRAEEDVFLTAPMVACGNGTTFAVKNDGTLWAWGANGAGQLGDGTTTRRYSPVQVTALSRVVSVSAGGAHTVALTDDGSVWTWGSNAYGQLGDGTTTGRSLPARVAGLSGVTAVSAGAVFTMALKSDGTVWMWGSNHYGQLGDGTTEDRLVPVQVTNLTDVTAIAAGGWHAAAVRQDGSVWCWGYNNSGRLGNGTQTDSSVPVRAKTNSSPSACAVAASGAHTVELAEGGYVYCWGGNYVGQSGTGSSSDYNLTPNFFRDTKGHAIKDVTAIAAGENATVALKSDGTVYASGMINGDWNLEKASYKATLIEGLWGDPLTNVTSIAVGSDHFAVATKSGRVLTWGKNDDGQLGDGTQETRTYPWYICEADSDEPFNINPTITEYSISMSETALELRRPDPVQLSVTFQPALAQQEKTVSWVSSDPSVAAVDENGSVTAVAPGTATITATVEDKQVSCAVTVVAYTVTFDANGGKKVSEPMVKFPGQALTLKASASRDNFLFRGWSDASDGEILYQYGDRYETDADITLYAMWQLVCSKCNGKGTIRYDCTRCKGSGKLYTTLTCQTCNGKGKLYETVTKSATCALCHGSCVTWSDSQQCWVPCTFCGATGVYEWTETVEKECKNCGGTGSITQSRACSSCSGKGYYTEQCSDCGGTGGVGCLSTKHQYVFEVTPPTCTEQGYTTRTCSICGLSGRYDFTVSLDHDYQWVIDQEATATTAGYRHEECTRCGKSRNENTVIPPTGGDHVHSYDRVVVAPTCTERGYTKYTCACGSSYADAYVAALGHEFRNGVCTRCGRRDAQSELPCSGGDSCPGRVFADMPAKGNWAHDAVDWAVCNNVTAGTAANAFSPNAGCTRAQVVTFLWRAAGMPEPSSGRNPFADVQKGAYYYKAVLWAVENKITAGTGTTTFSPDDTCTRAQIVAFLWRYEREPAPASARNPFADVPAGAYYEKAVLWAAENDVTAGTSATTFSPDDTCTRAQVVTFLYRDVEKN